MKKTTVLILALSWVATGSVQAEETLPVPGYPAATPMEGSHLQPDPGTEYKVVFDFVMTDDDLDDPYPMLPLVARYLNTLAKWGVPEENRKIAVVLHRGSGLIGLKNDEFRARHDGRDNPNIDLIRDLHEAGVSFHLCGQGVLARKVDPDDVMDEIQVDLWALTTLVELGRQGYVKFGG